jgi:hypothetical protein
MTRRFLLTLTCEVELDEEQIWPDHDGPAAPSADDVVELIETLYREPHQVIEEWGLEQYVRFDVVEVKS